MKRVVAILLVVLMLVGLFSGCGKTAEVAKDAPAEGTKQEAPAEVKTDPMEVMLYSSMKDDQLAALKEGFMGKYPDVKMDYYTAGTGDVMTKVATEKQAGGSSADIIWVGDPTHYADMKGKGWLETYISPEAQYVPDMFKDKDNQFCGARIVTMGFVYNTTLVKPEEVPKTWDDLLKPRFKDEVGITDPTFSGTSLTTVAGLTNDSAYGWEYFENLKKNGLKLEKGSSAVVTKVGAGEYQVSIGADYIARTMIAQGSTMGFVLPEQGVPLVASPIGILKDTKNLDAAKLLYDYILSEDGQNVLIKTFTSPVRQGMELKDVEPIESIVKKAFVVDEAKLIADKQGFLDKFDSIFKKD